MSLGAKVGVGLALVALAGGAFGVKHWKELVARAEAAQVEASRALMQSEELVWTLEGECLKDAQRVLAMPDAKQIAASAGPGAEERERVERRLRQFLRIRRNPKVWKATERAFLTMTNESRAATNAAAIKAGLRPVDILSEWMTWEGASDLVLMTNVFEDREKLRGANGAVLETLLGPNPSAPEVGKGVRVVEHTDERVVVDLFGAHVVEEWVKGKAVAVSSDGKAKITWKSNYNFLRELVRGGKPEAVLEETLVPTDEGFGVEYRDWIAEYLAGGDKLPWATVLCLKGPLEAGSLKGEKEEPGKGEKPEKPGEKGEKPGEKTEKPGEK